MLGSERITGNHVSQLQASGRTAVDSCPQRRDPVPFLVQSDANPVRLRRPLVSQQMAAVETVTAVLAYEQVNAAVAIDITADHTSRVKLERDSQEEADLDKVLASEIH